MQTVQTQVQPVTAPSVVPVPEGRTAVLTQPELIIYSHSPLLYWWPIWVVGYVMAALTYWQGEQVVVGGNPQWFHPSSNLGVLFCFTLFLVILSTNITVRGLASALVIVSGIAVSVTLAYFNLWDDVLNFLGGLRIYLNLGAYFWFSTLMFLVWAFTVFVFDRMSYWRLKPGQLTHEFVFGASAKSYDTENMVVEKFRDDLFRHWLLGLGAGDLYIRPYGPNREEIAVPNVLLLGSKVRAIEQLVASQPDQVVNQVRVV